MTKEPLNIQKILDDFHGFHVSMTLRSDNVYHFKEYEQFLTTSLRKAMEAVKPRNRKLLGAVLENDVWRMGYNKALEDLEQNMTIFFKK